jgi:hypothetical protein
MMSIKSVQLYYLKLYTPRRVQYGPRRVQYGIDIALVKTQRTIFQRTNIFQIHDLGGCLLWQ